MRDHWVKCTVKDFLLRGEAELKTGPFGTQLHASDYVATGTPVINVRNIGFGEVRIDQLEFISEKTVQRLQSHLLEPSDIVFGRKGAVERHAFIRQEQSRWFQGSDCLRLRFHSPEVDPRFISFCFLTESHKSWMLSQCSHGSTMASLNQEIISRITLNLPSLPTQRKIAAILGAYDDLIENNTRRIAILERLAQALYREWFVHFRFPGHATHQMIESPLGLIPAGWEVAPFSRIARISRSGIDPNKFKSETFAHYSIPAFDVDRMPVIEQGETIKSSKFILTEEVILLSKINPNIPRVWMPFLDNRYRAITSTEFLVLEPQKPSTRVFLYNLCQSLEFMQSFAAYALGTSTSHQRVKHDDLLSLQVVLPGESLIRKFDSLVAPMLALIHNHRLVNTNLRRTRDLLLPKLISGEVDVDKLDAGVGGVEYAPTI